MDGLSEDRVRVRNIIISCSCDIFPLNCYDELWHQKLEFLSHETNTQHNKFEISTLDYLIKKILKLKLFRSRMFAGVGK